MAKDFKKKKEEHFEQPKSEWLAKKDFVIFQNEYHRVIKQGEDVSDVPEKFWENLKTEGIL